MQTHALPPVRSTQMPLAGWQPNWACLIWSKDQSQPHSVLYQGPRDGFAGVPFLCFLKFAV